ncbi:MAG: tryptophan-rich sensory protein [Cyclobacteriaceae bacterium]
MTAFLKVLNIILFIGVITVNTLANTLKINGHTTGSVSAQYANYFTPAGFTFSIWSLIYLSLMVFVVYQAFPFTNRNRQPIAERLGFSFVINCVANMGWIFTWHYMQFELTLFFMLVLLGSLIAINLRIEKYSWLVRVPFRIYLGWICVATIANFAVYFKYLNWSGFGLAETSWAILLVVIAGALGIWLIIKKSFVLCSITICWGLFGIFMNQYAAQSELSTYAVICLLAIAAVSITAVWKGLFLKRAI